MADASVVDSYEATTGWEVLQDVLDCYRLWWDLSEICGYVTLLRDTHDGTDDIRESWKNLQHFLDPPRVGHNWRSDDSSRQDIAGSRAIRGDAVR